MSEYITEEELWDEESSLDAEIEITDLEVDDQSKILQRKKRVKIERPLGGTWSGVRGCNDGDRAQRALDKAHEKFLREVLFEYRHMVYINSGATMTGWGYRNGRAPFPDNNRWCRGWIKGGKGWAIFEER